MTGTEYLGLCNSCKHASACTFTTGPKRPALYCEEFEIEPPQAKTPSESIPSESTRPLSFVDSALNQGLCSDCENRDACCLSSRPEGGVWHCEEYK